MIKTGKGKGKRARRAKDQEVHHRDAIRKLTKINQYVLVIIVDFASSLLMARGARGASMCVGNGSNRSRASIDSRQGAKNSLFENPPLKVKQFHNKGTRC